MPKTFKGFVPSEAVTFTLESPDGSRAVTLRCKPNIPGSKFLAFMGRTDQENPGTMAVAVREILDEALSEESSADFWAFADDGRNGIDLETLAEIAGWLSETFAGTRPTVPRSA